MKIDAAVHFWKFEKPVHLPLFQNNKLFQQHYLPEQIAQSLQRNSINGCIAVNSETSEVETRFLCELSLTHPLIRGVVGWIDLADTKAAGKIQEFRQYMPIRGYRFEFRKERQPSATVMELLQENQYNLDVSLPEPDDSVGLGEWIAAYPGQVFIMQDSGNPDTKKLPAKEWEQAIRHLAKNPNLNCKVSGLLERGNLKTWKPADFYPFLEILFDAFGTERLLFASDWPFILSAGIYVQWKSLLEKFMEKFVEEDRDKFFGENARRLYRL